MDMQGQVLENIVGTLHARFVLPLRLLQKSLYTRLEFRIEPSHLPLHHRNDLVVMLQPQQYIFLRSELLPKRPDLHTFDRILETTRQILPVFLLEDVYSGGE